MEPEYYETELVGNAVCLASISDAFSDEIIITHITIPAKYTPDWQSDGGFSHDEGWFDYDSDDAYVTYPDEYQIVQPNGVLVEGKGEVKKLKQIFSSDLNEKV